MYLTKTTATKLVITIFLSHNQKINNDDDDDSS